MENLLHNLKTLLQKDERLISEGEFLKNKIIELALKLDKDLIKLLLSDKEMKEVFFADVDGTLIFDKDKFMRFVSNKQFLPDSYTAFKNKIGLTDDGHDDFISQKKDVVLVWPYKDCVLEGGMTKENQKRDEVFWNKTLAPDEISRLFDPKVFTNAKRTDKKGEHKLDKFRTDENGNIKDNLIIKGNNLLALYSLKKRFAGKVKLIYIDPPYNTGNDSFKYNDSFNHSTWLTFMRNRLEVAKEFLREDGVIFVSCDDNEEAYLKVLMDGVFGRENFIVNFIWGTKKGAQGMVTKNMVVNNHENLIVFAKFKSNFRFNGLERDISDFHNPDNDPRGLWKRQYLQRFGQGFKKRTIINPQNGVKFTFESPYTEEKMNKWIKESIIIFPDDPNKYPARKEFLSRYESKKQLVSLLGLYSTKSSTEDLYKLFGGEKIFKNPKPPKLIKFVINQSTKKDDIVIDFFSGSGTTAQAVLELNKEDGGNRKFILAEQLDEHIEVCKKRIKKVIKKIGSGDFVYLELMKWNENFVERIQKAKTKNELKKLWEIMKKKAFLSYKIDIKAVDENAKDFKDLSIEDQKKFLLQCLDKNHLYVNYSDIDDEEYGVSEEDKRINKEFYQT